MGEKEVLRLEFFGTVVFNEKLILLIDLKVISELS